MRSDPRQPAGPKLFLLGGVALDGVPPDGADQLVRQSKVVGLLACLALAPSGAFTRRDRLVGLLWPELDQVHARASLRKAIHYARSVLGDEAVVGRGDEELALGETIWCDAIELRSSIDRDRLARAVELYRGDLMPGFYLPECHDFDAWLEEQRSALRETAVAAKPVTGTDSKVGENTGTQAKQISGNNVHDYRDRVQRIGREEPG